MSKEVAKLLAAKFIARSDVKAIQRTSGDYNPVTTPITMSDLVAHQDGILTYGHYLLNPENQCKLFAFDIDLDEPSEKMGTLCYVPTDVDSDGNWCNFQPGNPRELWKDRTAILQRNYFKYLLRMMANMLARQIHDDFGIPTAVAYTGAKGVHVYGFTGLLPAVDVRKGAELILKATDKFEPHRGDNFFKHKNVQLPHWDHEASYSCLTVEVFPKQTTIQTGGYGNLLRLPLGKNLKNPQDPTFFMDLRGAIGSKNLMPRDPVDALTTTDQWA